MNDERSFYGGSMKSFSFIVILLVSSSSFAQDMDASGGSNNNHGVSQGCEGNGCQYSSSASRRRARQRFRDEEMKNLEQIEGSQEKPQIKVQPIEDTQ